MGTSLHITADIQNIFLHFITKNTSDHRQTLYANWNKSKICM